MSCSAEKVCSTEQYSEQTMTVKEILLTSSTDHLVLWCKSVVTTQLGASDLPGGQRFERFERDKKGREEQDADCSM